MRITGTSGWAGMTVLLSAAFAPAADIAPQVRQIKAVGPRGEGHREAQAALRELMGRDADALLPILEAGEDANPLAMNWLRSGFETIAQRTLTSGRELPLEQFEQFVRDTSRSPRMRRLAYEWLVKVDPSAPDRLIPGMADDPSEEFRRDAVARLIDRAQRDGSPERVLRLWREALDAAADEDQVKTIVAALEEHGAEVDLVRHFGILTEWSVIGPFDNQEMKGFDVVYPPETEIDLSATYDGQLGPVQWRSYRSAKPDGTFDIGELIENYKGSAMYAVTTFSSDRERDAEFRFGTPNAWKLWLNGEFLFSHEEYHRGTSFDQYRVPGRLRPGSNVILLKIHQNEQEQDWAQVYKFKFRVTDASGRAIHPQNAERR